MIKLDSKELSFAIEAVSQAALLARRIQVEMVSPALTKEDRSPVTVADYAVQALIGRQMQLQMPQARLVGEEDASALLEVEGRDTLRHVTEFVRSEFSDASEADVAEWIDIGQEDPSNAFWTLDPVDGTKGFLRGEQYAVALAKIEDGEVQIGVLGCPNIRGGYQADVGGEGTLIVAVKGQGSWYKPLKEDRDFRVLQRSMQDDRSHARLLLSAEAGHTNLGQLGEIAQHLGVGAEPVRMDSQAKYGVLAAGEGELLFRLISAKAPDYKEKIWDQAAGSLIVEESGGRVSDLDGKPLDFSLGRTLKENRGVIASNGLLHEDALEAIRAVGA